jgi:hypothetical protein
VVDGLALAVTRIVHKTVTQTQVVPFPVTEQKDAALTKGTRKVITAGHNGSKQAVFDVTFANGEEAGRALLSSTVTDQPVAAVVRLGTKPAPASSSGSTSGYSGGSADSLNWAALARCESGGNARAVNPAGYYGLYQFSLSTWHAMGGSGNPINASPAEQLMRAKMLYNKAGAGQWGCGRHLFD